MDKKATIRTRVSETIRKAPFAEAQTALGKQKNTFCGTPAFVPLQKYVESCLQSTDSDQLDFAWTGRIRTTLLLSNVQLDRWKTLHILKTIFFEKKSSVR